MKALILAAGEGSRLRPLTSDKPKPMLPIAGRPLLEHILLWLKGHGVHEVAINLHYKPEAITGYLGDGARWGMAITYSPEDPVLGTAGAAKKLEGYFRAEAFLVVYGDVLTDLDLGALVGFHRSRGGVATLALYRVENPSACGLVDVDGRGRIRAFVEKPPPDEVFTDLANAGVLVLEPEIFDHIPPGIPYDFGLDLLPRLLQEGVALYGQPISDDEYLIDIGTLDKYERAQGEWQSGEVLS
ncbi:NDP-sugar synthase [Chloroflexota bacterium]